jgi:hypothetical protein
MKTKGAILYLDLSGADLSNTGMWGCNFSGSDLSEAIRVDPKPKEEFMKSQLAFFVSVAFSFIAWGIVAARYIWPQLRLQQPAAALRPLLILHSFRFLGLAFLVPGGRVA